MLTVATASSASRIIWVGVTYTVDSKNWLPNVLIIPPIGTSDPIKLGLEPENLLVNQFNDHSCSHFNVKGNVLFVDKANLLERIAIPFTYVNWNGIGTQYKRREFYVTGQTSRFAIEVNVWGSRQTSTTPNFKRNGTLPYSNMERTVYFVRSQYAVISTILYSRKTSQGPVESILHSTTVLEFDATFTKMRSSALLTYSVDEVDISTLKFGSFATITNSFSLGSSSNLKAVLPNLSSLRVRFENSRLRQNGVPDDVKFGDLTQTAADNTRALEINTPMYLRDLLNVMQLSKQIVRLATGGLSAKTITAAYLVAHYGLKLTIQDTKEIAKALAEAHDMDMTLPYQVARARASETATLLYGFGAIPLSAKIDYSMKLYYDPVDDGIRQLWRQLLSWDVVPTASNIWDMIPFSFVVDWFIGIGDQLERLDSTDYMRTLRIQSSVYSKRTSVSMPAEFFLGKTTQGTYIGAIELIDYHRYVQAIPPQPISRFDVPKNFTHWVEGAAIVVQTIK